MIIQSLKILVPPTIHELLSDPIYKAFAKKNPYIPKNVSLGMPWQIIVRRTPGAEKKTWAIKEMPTYADCFDRMKKLLHNPQIEDIVICSRRVLFKPPLDFEWSSRFNWCGRCRRPSLFREMYRHPLLSKAPTVSFDSPQRCYYCAMRQVAMPHYRPRKKA